MSKKTLFPLGALAAGMLAFAGTSSAGIINVDSGPTFTPESAFTNNTIVLNTTIEGGLIDLKGSATVTSPDSNSALIDVEGNYSADAGETFSVAYSFSVDLNIPEPVNYVLTTIVVIGGIPVPIQANGTLMPGVHKYEGSAAAPGFSLPETGNFSASLQLIFTPTGSALSAAAGTLDLDIQQLDFKVDPLPAAVLPPSQPQNLSTRGNVGTGEDVLIGGFIITGNDDKQVVLRAIGPSIPSSEVSGSLADPVLELHDSTGAVVATNDNWMDLSADDQTVLTDNNLQPTNDAESALVETLAPGQYTVIVSGANESTGVALVEAYDLDNGGTDSNLANISTRSNVTPAEGSMIAGFIVGNGGFSSTVIRGLGPSLAAQSITNFLADPMLELHDADGNVIDSNDNWMDGTNMDQVVGNGLAPTDANEAALFEVLPPGMYTAVLSGVGATSGVALVEVYDTDDAPPPVVK